MRYDSWEYFSPLDGMLITNIASVQQSGYGFDQVVNVSNNIMYNGSRLFVIFLYVR